MWFFGVSLNYGGGFDERLGKVSVDGRRGNCIILKFSQVLRLIVQPKHLTSSTWNFFH